MLVKPVSFLRIYLIDENEIEDNCDKNGENEKKSFKKSRQINNEASQQISQVNLSFSSIDGLKRDSTESLPFLILDSDSRLGSSSESGSRSNLLVKESQIQSLEEEIRTLTIVVICTEFALLGMIVLLITKL